MNDMKYSEILRAAKAVIENPENWIQGMYARKDRNGPRADHLLGFDEGATCWCSVGALQKVKGDEFIYPLERRLSDAARALVGGLVESAVHFNDNNPHYKVMRMFDVAIATAEEEESRGE